MKNKLFGLPLTICLALASAVPASASTFPTSVDTSSIQSSINLNDSLSVESYKDWITSQINMRNSNSYEAQNFLNEFNNLTEDEQELFVSYINDSDLTLNILNLLSTDEDYSTLENGNIIISNDQTFQDKETTVANRATIQNRTATGTQSVTILGIKTFEYKGEIRYSHNGSSISGISHSNIWISRNFIPLVDFSWSNASTYGVGSSTARHINYCTWSFVHQSFGMTYGTHQIQISGNVKNQTTFTVK